MTRTRRIYNNAKKQGLFFFWHKYKQFRHPNTVEIPRKPHDWAWDTLRVHYRPDVKQFLRDAILVM